MSAFDVEKLPKSFLNEVESQSSELIVIRSSVSDLEEVNRWVKEFGLLTNTKWNSRSSKPRGERFVCAKKFVCHHSSFMKIPSDANKRTKSKNSGCTATIRIRLKLHTGGTIKTDKFVKKGLCAVIKIMDTHNHPLNTAESLKFLPSALCRETFIGYFNKGMGITASRRHHEEILRREEKYSEEEIVNGYLNPTYRCVQYWHDKWSLENHSRSSCEGGVRTRSRASQTATSVQPSSTETNSSPPNEDDPPVLASVIKQEPVDPDNPPILLGTNPVSLYLTCERFPFIGSQTFDIKIKQEPMDSTDIAQTSLVDLSSKLPELHRDERIQFQPLLQIKEEIISDDEKL